MNVWLPALLLGQSAAQLIMWDMELGDTISTTWARTMSSTRPVASGSGSATSPETNIICWISISIS